MSTAPQALTAHGPPITGGEKAPLILHNLLNDLATLAGQLVGEVRRGSWLDAYLLAAGMEQIAADHLHPEIYPLDRAADFLLGQPSPAGRLAGRTVAAIASTGRALTQRRVGTRRVVRWQRDLAKLVAALADASVGRTPTAAQQGEQLESSRALAGDLDELPRRLRRDVVRVPVCFHGFDQRPSDLGHLVREFGDRWPDRRRPLLVVGVRTSGSYLAPLCASFLRAHGYEDVEVLTVRPGRGLLKHERDLVRSVARRRGLALVTDDPPVTGSSVAGAARELERVGVVSEAIVLLLQVFAGDAVLPSTLQRYQAVRLPSTRWTVSEKLTPSEVERALSNLLGPGTRVLSVAPLPLPAPQSARDHLRARFRVRFRDAAQGHEAEKEVLVEGVGLGYFGAHSLTAARVLERFSPTVFGVQDGLLYREWLPDEWRVGPVEPGDEEFLAATIAAYVIQRRGAFPVAEDVSLRLVGELPAWEVASSILSRGFGRAWPIAKVLLTDRAAKRLLRVERPSVVDGNTDLAHWFRRNGSRQAIAKVNLGDQRFSTLGLRCFDAAFDLAGVTARDGTPSFARRLRRAYTELGAEQIDEERWLLYELAHLWGRQRTQPEKASELRRARSRAVQRYFADTYFRDVTASRSGPLCALDIDGVLETEHLGFPALTPSAALALRALMVHGFRPVLVSGRGLGEVVERCRAYGLAAAVAEYGAAIYESRAGVCGLLRSEQAGAMAQLRAWLAPTEGIHLDEGYRFGVRAFRIERGQRLGLHPETIAGVLAGLEGIRAIEGEGQTDFMVADVDKGTGLRALMARLDRSEANPGGHVALAVGDTVSDLPLAALAAKACAPAHAHAALRGAGFEMMSRPYQAGLAQAVGKLIGHTPGRCGVCRMPRPTQQREILLMALAAQERGRRGMPLQALKLASRIR
jgi:hydroxymethylpyrimidine pyrophosphatase-like HAD family hydrolase